MSHTSSNELKKIDMMSQGNIISFDVTKNAYYGKGLKDNMLKSKPKDGTSRFNAYMVAHSSNREYDIPLAYRRITDEKKMSIILLQMLKKIIRTRTLIELILLDRGFFFSKVYKHTQKYG